MFKKIIDWLKIKYNEIFFIGCDDKLPPPLSREEELHYLTLYKTGDESAKEVLIEHNLRLVVFLAKKYESTGYDIEDLVSKACETTKNTYTQELKSEFISSYEAKIQQLITGSKIEKLKAEKSAIANKRVSIIGKLLGKEKLKMAQLEKFNKKMEIQRLRTYARGFRDFSTTEEKGIMTTEMEEFIKLLESKPEFADITKEVKGIFERVTEQENQNTQLVPKSPKVSIRKQLKSVEQENEMLSGEIRTIKIQDAEIKSKDVSKKIANTKSDALTQFEMVLQNAEKALHIEDERENNRVMQEDLAR